LVAYGPNQTWSWDITKLLGPQKWTYYYLYVVIDIFSRYIPGWLLATCESAELAERFLAETIRKHHIVADQLTLHSDHGTSMASKTVALLLADLGVTKSHSRPHCSNDNPFSEAHFKTLKYRPEFPDRFGSIEDGRAVCQRFFRWYNDDHHHSGLGFTYQPTCTSVVRRSSNSNGRASWRLLTRHTLNASCASCLYRRLCQGLLGSTNLRRCCPQCNSLAARSHQS
jgi:transposase InsO family protein